MTNKKLIPMVALSIVAITGLSLAVMYESGDIGISDYRYVGHQYTPWDTDRMVKHSDVVIRGTVIFTEPTVETQIGYHDGTDEIEQTKQMPYQLVTIQISEVLKGEVGKTITVKDFRSAIVLEEGHRVKVVYQNALTYDGGETGLFFIENRDGQFVIDGYYNFLQEDDNDFKSGYHYDHSFDKVQKSQVTESVLKQ